MPLQLIMKLLFCPHLIFLFLLSFPPHLHPPLAHVHQHPEGEEAVDHGHPFLVFIATGRANHEEFLVEDHAEHFDPQHATRIRSRSDPPSSGQWCRRGSGARGGFEAKTGHSDKGQRRFKKEKKKNPVGFFQNATFCYVTHSNCSY